MKIAVLTNGLLWWFYLPLREGSWEQRKFFAVDIQQQDPPVAARHFKDFLHREAVSSGDAVKRAEEMHAGREKARRIRESLPNAWRQICERPDELLIELLAEKVESLCGYRPDQEVLTEYLAKVLGGKPVKQRETPRGPTRPPTGPTVPAPGGYTFKKVVAYSFQGERHEVRAFKEVLLGICCTLYGAHRADFDKVLTLAGRRRSYFSRGDGNMTKPREIPGTGIYAETNFSANHVMDRCNEVLALFGYSPDDLTLELHDR